LKYALLIFHEEEEGEDRSQSDLTPWIEFSEQAKAYGAELAGAPLDSIPTAKVVSVRGGRSVITDGPLPTRRSSSAVITCSIARAGRKR
jgi:hypothetical protein